MTISRALAMLALGTGFLVLAAAPASPFDLDALREANGLEKRESERDERPTTRTASRSSSRTTERDDNPDRAADEADRGQRRQSRETDRGRADRPQTERDRAEDTRPVPQRLNDVLTTVDLRDVTVREALAWFSDHTGIPIVVNWDQLMMEGVDPDGLVDLRLRHVPAGRLLSLLMEQMAPDRRTDMLYEATQWYVRIMTREQANQRRVLRIYDIRELLHEVPDFVGVDRAGRNDFGNGFGGGLFDDTPDRQRGGGFVGGRDAFGDRAPTGTGVTDQERGEALVELIQAVIEPDVWDRMGGESTIRYYRGHLIINAPLHVHRQIGTPVGEPRRPTGGR